MKNYRCTRNLTYQDKLVPNGYQTPYLIQAESHEEALAKMRQSFPDDHDDFNVVLWNEWLSVGASYGNR